MKNNRTLSIFLSVLLGITYIFSGATKGMDIGSFSNLLLSYGSSWFTYLAPIITGFEIFLGFCMLLGPFNKRFAQVSVTFILVLTTTYLVGYFFKDLHDCGCFGEILKLSPSNTLFKNGILLIISYWLWQYSTYETYRKWLIAIPITFGLITTSINGLEFRGRINNDLRLQNLDLKYTFLKPYLLKGKQKIIIFNPKCEPCRKASKRLNTISSNVLGFYGSGYSELDVNYYVEIVKPKFPIHVIPADTINKYFVEVPTVLNINDGLISSIDHY